MNYIWDSINKFNGRSGFGRYFASSTKIGEIIVSARSKEPSHVFRDHFRIWESDRDLGENEKLWVDQVE